MINIFLEKINIAIVEDNKKISDSIVSYLKSTDLFDIVGVAYDGEEALKLIKQESIDVVLLDIILPIMDGISVLEELSKDENFKKPAIIMLTAISSSTFTQKALNLGADYFMLKPFDLNLLSKRIVDIHKFRKKEKSNPKKSEIVISNAQSLDSYISNVLKLANIPNTTKGYMYLKTAIALGIEDESLANNITRKLYPIISEKYDTSISCVERAIRHAIKVSWDKSLNSKFYTNLGYNFSTNSKPTNRSFILSIIDSYKNNFYL